jgi:hypothetical protein
MGFFFRSRNAPAGNNLYALLHWLDGRQPKTENSIAHKSADQKHFPSIDPSIVRERLVYPPSPKHRPYLGASNISDRARE